MVAYYDYVFQLPRHPVHLLTEVLTNDIEVVWIVEDLDNQDLDNECPLHCGRPLAHAILTLVLDVW